MPYPTIFLARDGVINYDHSYACKKKDFDFIEGVFNLFLYAQSQCYKFIVFTIQMGIARVHYSEEALYQLSGWMCQQFFGVGGLIERVYCPPLPHNCRRRSRPVPQGLFSRKSRPGVILKAQNDLSLDLARSVLVGDIKTGNAAGVGTNLLFAPKCPIDLSSSNYELIATWHKAMPYLQRVQQ
jgi:D-glycero-D-manno-heptose 1,7-bisphosphate phosphatase